MHILLRTGSLKVGALPAEVRNPPPSKEGRAPPSLSLPHNKSKRSLLPAPFQEVGLP